MQYTIHQILAQYMGCVYIIFQLLQLVCADINWVQLQTFTSEVKNTLSLAVLVCSVSYVLPELLQLHFTGSSSSKVSIDMLLLYGHLCRPNCVISILLQGHKSWKSTKSRERSPRTFESKCLREILGIKWSRFIAAAKICQSLSTPYIQSYPEKKIEILRLAIPAISLLDILVGGCQYACWHDEWNSPNQNGPIHPHLKQFLQRKN